MTAAASTPTAVMQGSLLDALDAPGFGPLHDTVTRHTLTRGAWVDYRPGWLSGSDALFEELLAVVPWQAEHRQMWDSYVAVPRLTRYYDTGAALPHPLLAQARELASAHYRAELGEDFTSAGLCLYRDGADSVAWHGDTKGRGSTADTMIAILSLGAPRGLSLRPRGGGPITRFDVGHGDLLVMGGSCQRTWEHAVLKTSRPVGPRISIQFRPKGVW